MSKIGWWKTACAVFVFCIAAASALPAQTVTVTVLHAFNGRDGADSHAALIQGTDGNLYGTTSSGGTGDGGTVFEITPRGKLTTLYSFCSQNNCADGETPYAGVIQASDGNFYGTTYHGGANGDYGTVFRITPDGTLTTLYSFCSQSDCTDGERPAASLIQATDGNLYGTTTYGGANGYICGEGCGTVFEITPSGTLTTLYSFCSQAGCLDGADPYAALIQGTDGNFYGITVEGGANSCIVGTTNYGCGTLFRIAPGGTLTTLYNFCSVLEGGTCTDGEYPQAPLLQAVDGNFYGTTSEGGTKGNLCYFYGCGTAFSITPNGTLTTLHRFFTASGAYPYGALVQAANGNFYGTTLSGGDTSTHEGAVYELTPNGALRTLLYFCGMGGGCDGGRPWAALFEGTDGNLYGTTSYAGKGFDGTVLSVSVGLSPFVETQPASGHVGAGVRILGTDLTGATSVTFNDTPAVFKVVKSSYITTTVPAGATTGTVQVVTPGGTLLGNVPFQVLP
jgi:uncharacterized repeat protein (TIGR03803 family)